MSMKKNSQRTKKSGLKREKETAGKRTRYKLYKHQEEIGNARAHPSKDYIV